MISVFQNCNFAAENNSQKLICTMYKELKCLGEMLKNSTYLADLKEQNDLLRQKMKQQKNNPENLYLQRQHFMLRPQQDMKRWVTENYDMRHNIVTDVYEYRHKNEPCWTVIDRRQLNTIANEVADAGIFCLDSQVKRYVESASSVDYHPVTEYLDKVRGMWDGKTDYADDLLRRISTDPYFLRMGRIWLRAVVAQWMHWDEKHANAVMLLLVSERQGMQKSTLLRELMPESLRDYYTDDFSLSSKGNAQRKMVEFALINIDEFDKEPVRKMAELKTLMQSMKPSFIGAYKKNFNRLPRIASFVGTSNHKQLLSDPTGSRRFLVVEPENKICVDGICHDQLYAQLIEEIKSGEQYFFTKEDEALMESHNRPYRRLNAEEQLLTKFFREDHEGEKYCRLGASEILKHLNEHNHTLMRNISVTTMGKLINGLGWHPIHTELGNVYNVVKL